MISCRELVELLYDYTSNELPPERRDQVEHHLHRCPPCAAYADSYAAVIRITRSLPAAPLPPHLAQRLAAVLHTHQHGA